MASHSADLRGPSVQAQPNLPGLPGPLPGLLAKPALTPSRTRRDLAPALPRRASGAGRGDASGKRARAPPPPLTPIPSSWQAFDAGWWKCCRQAGQGAACRRGWLCIRTPAFRAGTQGHCQDGARRCEGPQADARRPAGGRGRTCRRSSSVMSAAGRRGVGRAPKGQEPAGSTAAYQQAAAPPGGARVYLRCRRRPWCASATGCAPHRHARCHPSLQITHQGEEQAGREWGGAVGGGRVGRHRSLSSAGGA